MITIKDIAQQLGLSPSTVGRAIADHPRISRETKERVRIAAKDLGYVANTPARVMRGGSSRLVGLLVPDVRNSFFSMVAYVLSKCFENEGFHLALSITDDDRDTEMQQVREMVSARVAGLVIVPSAAPRRETLTLLQAVPHVQFLRRLPEIGTDWFGLDEERALLDATNHLLHLGHRRIAYIGDIIFPTGKARYEGFRRAYRLPRSEWGFWQRRMRALLLVPIVLVPMALATLVLVFGRQIESLMFATANHELRHVVLVEIVQ